MYIITSSLPVCYVVSVVHLLFSHLYLFFCFPVPDFLPDSCYSCFDLLPIYELPACFAPLDLFACLDCLLVPDCKPVNLSIDLDKALFLRPVLPQYLHLDSQSYYLVHTSVTVSHMSTMRMDVFDFGFESFH